MRTGGAARQEDFTVISNRAAIRKLPSILVSAAGLIFCLLPAEALAPQPDGSGLVAAVTAPSPLKQEHDPAAAYREAAARMDELGLTQSQRSTLWARMDDGLLARLKAGGLTGPELTYLTLPHYRSALADRYAAYAQTNPELDADTVVTTVNMGLDRDFYADPEPVTAPDSTTVLVNKYHVLDAGYTPELEVLGSGYGSGSLRPEAARQFRAMADAARTDGITLYSVSAYRSYRTQTSTYNRYLSQSSRQTVDTFSARPGHSEHQTGLALDINTAQSSAHFEDTAEYAWLTEHCAEYGFLLRYPEDQSSITGYRFEPWHYRYVGTEIARICMEQGLTYEEYAARLPAEELNRVPTLSCLGQVLDLEGEALVLEGANYLSAARLAQALGWSAADSGAALTLSDGAHQLTLTSGRRCLRDGRMVKLSSPALDLDGTLYLTLDDLCSLLDLTVRSTPLGLELVPCEVL